MIHCSTTRSYWLTVEAPNVLAVHAYYDGTQGCEFNAGEEEEWEFNEVEELLGEEAYPVVDITINIDGDIIEDVVKEDTEMSTTFSSYQKLSARTLKANPQLTNMALGLAGETGEVIDHLKKYLFHGHTIDPEKVTEELGDVLWYVAGLCTILGVDMECVATGNIDKLKKRYPEGFDEEKSIERSGSN